MFTHKHYEFFAKFYGKYLRSNQAFVGIRVHTESVLKSLIEEFKADNPKFKEDLFLKRVHQFETGERV